MPDNVLKATVDAISEEDNESGGTLITRLREAHEFGRDDGAVAAADPDRLVSPADVFKATDVGKGVDLLLPRVGGPTGNEGSYIVTTFVDAKNVDLLQVDGSAPGFINEDPVRWRFTTLRVETTLDFPSRDRLMQVYVGEEPSPVPYTELVQTPGVQEFRGLGAQRQRLDGIIASASPTNLGVVSDFFAAGDVGKAVWVYPTDPPNGNEGPQLITAFVDEKNVTVSPGGFAVDETAVRFGVKTYAEDGYLTKRGNAVNPKTFHRDLSEVVDGSGSFSQLDRLRRAMLSDFAEGDELDRIGRNLAVIRPRGLDDEIFRCLIQTLSYLPRATVYGIELVLECLFPGGDWEIYEDLVNFPNNVFLILPPLTGDSIDFEGKTWLAPSGNSVAPAVIAAGKSGRELQPSTAATTVDVTHPIISVVDVKLADDTQKLDMTVLPSADSPAWTFNTEGAGTPVEGTVFSVVNISGTLDVLGHTQPGGPTLDGGNYSRTITGEFDFKIGSTMRIGTWWRPTALGTVNGRPWMLGIRAAGIAKQVFLRWSDTDIALTNDTAGIPAGVPAAVAAAQLGTIDQWHYMELRLAIRPKGYFISAYLDGHRIFNEVNIKPFSSTALDEFLFGYEDQGGTQDWTVEWDRVDTLACSARNYFNRADNTGIFTGAGSDNLVDAGSPFVGGDVGKLVRTRGYQRLTDTFFPNNDGLWIISAFVGVTTVTLRGITYGPDGTEDRATLGATVAGSNAAVTALDRPGSREGALITLPAGDTGIFRRDDGPSVLDDATGGYDPVTGGTQDGKSIVITNATVPANNGTYEIIEWIDARTVRVDNPAGFTAETGLTWAFATTFVTSTGFIEYEVIAQGSFAAPTITLGDTLPSAAESLEIWYTSVLSAQLMRNEFVINQGALGAEPDIFYPFYLFDVDRATRQIMDEITAAGVIPEYARVF